MDRIKSVQIAQSRPRFYSIGAIPEQHPIEKITPVTIVRSASEPNFDSWAIQVKKSVPDSFADWESETLLRIESMIVNEVIQDYNQNQQYPVKKDAACQCTLITTSYEQDVAPKKRGDSFHKLPNYQPRKDSHLERLMRDDEKKSPESPPPSRKDSHLERLLRGTTPAIPGFNRKNSFLRGETNIPAKQTPEKSLNNSIISKVRSNSINLIRERNVSVKGLFQNKLSVSSAEHDEYMEQRIKYDENKQLVHAPMDHLLLNFVHNPDDEMLDDFILTSTYHSKTFSEVFEQLLKFFTFEKTGNQIAVTKILKRWYQLSYLEDDLGDNEIVSSIVNLLSSTNMDGIVSAHYFSLLHELSLQKLKESSKLKEIHSLILREDKFLYSTKDDKKYFTGKHGIDWFKKHLGLFSKEDAIILGNFLIQEGLLLSKTNEFSDVSIIYINELKMKDSIPSKNKTFISTDSVGPLNQCDSPQNIFSVLDFTVQDFAETLCLIEFNLFRKINLNELKHCHWMDKERKHQLSPNVLSMIHFSNTIINFFISEIVTTPSHKKRLAILKRIIKIGWKLFNLNNYNGVMEIVGCLQSSPVARLRSTWKYLSAKTHEKFFKYKTIMSSTNNFKNYRSALNEIITKSHPSLPYLGCYLTDLTFLETNKNLFGKDKHLVNCKKIRMLGTRFREFKYLQSIPYSFFGISSLQQSLLNFTPSLSDEDLFQFSKYIESPTNPIIDRIKITGKRERSFSFA